MLNSRKDWLAVLALARLPGFGDAHRSIGTWKRS
jgi:hypothetical protein